MSVGAAGRAEVLLEVENLRKHFPVTRGALLQRTVGHVKAVDGVSFSVRKGEALGLVGESGCGKTTIARCVLKLLEPTEGSIRFDGSDVETLDRQSTLLFRRRVQAIFQDPYSSLNPRMQVADIIGEPLFIHGCQSASLNGGLGPVSDRRDGAALGLVPSRCQCDVKLIG